MRKRNLLVAAGACLAALSLTVGTAVADPVGPPTFRELVGVGAETTQELFNAMSEVIRDSSGTKIIASYNNAPPGTITTKAPPANCTITRPNQGGSGTDALVNSLRQNDGCVQFARVVTNDSASRPGTGLTYIPVAIDALTYAVRSDSNIPRDLSIADLQDIYNCRVPGIEPLIGVFGAGNRTLFFRTLGITDRPDLVQQPGFTCIKDTDSQGQPLLANDGTLLTNPNQIVTYSTAPYLAQLNKVIPDKHGKAVLGSINGVSPFALNEASAIARDVYNVVDTNQIGAGTTINRVFVGPGSEVCSRSELIKRQGFGQNPRCGETTIRTTPRS